MKKSLSYDYDLYFESNKPITTPREFTDEIIDYCNQEKKNS